MLKIDMPLITFKLLSMENYLLRKIKFIFKYDYLLSLNHTTINCSLSNVNKNKKSSLRICSMYLFVMLQ
jgi:hypothetical protein